MVNSLNRSLCVLALVLFPACVTSAQSSGSPPDRDTVVLQLPLENGKLHVRDLLKRLCSEIGIAVPEAVEKMTWTIDVKSTLGRVQLKVLDRLADGAFATSVQGDRVSISVDKKVLRSRLAGAGTAVSGWLADIIGGVKKDEKAQVFGLTVVTEANPRTPVAEFAQLPDRMVVLVHGLDDPGFMWRDLIPPLRSAGLTVARFEYPNDGPVSDSADLFAAALMDLRSRGVQRVDIVAHSMGGLVMRDVLTRKAFYNGDGAGSNVLPAIDRFIMLGTPNHGSHMARLRGLGELREHLYRAFKGDVPAFSFGDDGDGEAAVDLLPDSDFLRRLNDRPMPTHTRFTIIAAQWSPVDGSDAKDLVQKVQSFAQSSSAPAWLRDLVNTSDADSVAGLMAAAVNGLGDGCVTIDSTRLDGVDDFHTVRGNHLSMIVNIAGATAVPPAIPIVLERLGVNASPVAPP